jgi:hypothetical protein
MDAREQAAAERLQDKLEAFFDSSPVPEPITIGDPLHAAIEAYRAALPGGHLPPDEAKLMRDVLDLSRFKSRNVAEQCDKRRDAQTVAGKWHDLLETKYGEPGAIPPEVLDRLTPSQAACLGVLTDDPKRTHEVAAEAKLDDATTARRALPALARMTPPLARKTPRGYVRAR